MYSAKLLEHFEHPRNVGEVTNPSAASRVENPACGDIMQLTLRIDGARITEARYQTRGCVAAIACGSALTEMITGLPLDTARGITRAALLQAVGGLPSESQHASHLAMDALSQALRAVVS